MYVAGVHLDQSQQLEALIAIASGTLWTVLVRKIVVSNNRAEKYAGPLKHLPPFLGRATVPAHTLFAVISPATFIYGVTSNRFVPSDFLKSWALPSCGFSPGARSVLRLAALGAFLAIGTRITQSAMTHLGSQNASIGIRQKPELVKTGPYRYVRHPVYAGLLLQTLVSTVMFWSYIPLYAFTGLSASIGVKIPIEEILINNDEEIGPQYKAYQQKVRYHIIPYIL